MRKTTQGFNPLTWLFLAIGVLVSCKTLPQVSPVETAQPRSILIREKSNDAERRNINTVSREIGDEKKELIKKHLGVIAKSGEPLPIEDNEVKLLIDGPATFEQVFSDIGGAKHSINVEIYIFDQDELGNKMKDLLIKKQKEGVKVKLIYDSVGSINTPQEFFDEMREAGVQVAVFNPINPAEGKILDINNRDHRKLVVVDGRIAFTGGINISAVYSRGSAQVLSSAKKSKNAPKNTSPSQNGWRDTQIKVTGPAVAEMQRVFFATWNTLQEEKIEAGEEPLPVPIQNDYYPKLTRAGDKILRVIASGPGDEKNIIYNDFLMAIKSAQKSVHITMAYFSPDDQLINELCNAEKRQAEVKLVLPGFSDVWMIFEAGRAHYSHLLNCGVEIYERHDALLHAKTVVIDGVWSTVGSTNMDMRSFLHNRELNVVVLGNDFGTEMEKLFAHDVEKSIAVTRESWKKRSPLARLRQWAASMFSYWL